MDRRDIVELMVASIRGTHVLERIRCLGWSPKHIGPRLTYQVILDTLGNEFRARSIQLVWEFHSLETNKDARYAKAYLQKFDSIYKHSPRFGSSYDARMSYFSRGIRTYYPRWYDRHVRKVADQPFRWALFFRDVAWEAIMGRFRYYPTEIARDGGLSIRDIRRSRQGVGTSCTRRSTPYRARP
ncbi:hypothetical protein N657DRAFT_70609 [Parathielavia appendiculata]|uniref:Uncharacterized protein n=1 Tax=Parathielavia appendiculata TaxID=2587402 RepID=A0AAN6Z9L5_9PEZI|nr:hypothetical protein N657DRAFT_70609 [Parathielavia appendiculata]